MASPDVKKEKQVLLLPSTPTKTRRFHVSTTAPLPRFGVEIDDKLSRCVRAWAYQVALELGIREVDHVVAFTGQPPDTKPDAFDAWLLEHMRTGLFAVAWAMFFMQNELCFTPVRLWHIVQSREWTHHFCRIVGLCHRRPQCLAADVVLVKELHAWQARAIARGIIRFDAHREAKAFTVVPSAPPPTIVDFTLRLARDALASRTLTDEQLEAFIEHQRLRGGTRRRLTSRRHAQVQLVDLVRMSQSMREETSDLRRDGTTGVRHDRRVFAIQRTRQWLTNFLTVGCACAS